jgi:hypothetical protein
MPCYACLTENIFKQIPTKGEDMENFRIHREIKFGQATVVVHQMLSTISRFKIEYEATISIIGGIPSLYLRNEIIDLVAQSNGQNVIKFSPQNRNVYTREAIDGNEAFVLTWELHV